MVGCDSGLFSLNDGGEPALASPDSPDAGSLYPGDGGTIGINNDAGHHSSADVNRDGGQSPLDAGTAQYNSGSMEMNPDSGSDISDGGILNLDAGPTCHTSDLGDTFYVNIEPLIPDDHVPSYNACHLSSLRSLFLRSRHSVRIDGLFD